MKELTEEALADGDRLLADYERWEREYGHTSRYSDERHRTDCWWLEYGRALLTEFSRLHQFYVDWRESQGGTPGTPPEVIANRDLVKWLRRWASSRPDEPRFNEAADTIERLGEELARARNPEPLGQPHIDLPERSPLRLEVARLRQALDHIETTAICRQELGDKAEAAAMKRIEIMAGAALDGKKPEYES